MRAYRRRSRMDFRSGPGPTPPGAAGPVGFRTFTETELAQNWPPDMSGARGGDVVLMSGNLWLKLSVDGARRSPTSTSPRSSLRTRLWRLGRRSGHPLHSGDRLLRAVCSVVQRQGQPGEPNIVKIAAGEPGGSQEVLGRQAGMVAAMGLHAGYLRARRRHGWIFPT